MSRIARYLDPRGRLDFGHVALLAIIIYLVGVVSGVIGTKTIEHIAAKPIILKTPTKQERSLLNRIAPAQLMTSGCYQPSASFFRLPQTWAIISSEYDYDAALLGSQPCQDSDYMQPTGAENVATLPGPSWVHYTFLWQQYIDGSGYEDTFEAPGTGHFAYLHLHYPKTFYAGQSLAGGTVVGRSGWPLSYAYSNGSCGDYYSCEVDAHLCVVTDWSAADWFYTLATNPPAKPKPPKKPAPKPKFDQALWDRYALSHHHTRIPAYQGTGKHRTLRTEARLWVVFGAKKAGSARADSHWTPPARKHGYGHMDMVFVNDMLTYWPHTSWVKWTRR